jgi:chromosome partitioning protein
VNITNFNIVQCEHCNTRFRVDAKLATRQQLRLRCSKCNQIFLAKLIPTTTPAKSARVITFCNQKGGVAKTTSCWNIGIALARQRQRVLCVDFDPQANLSLLAGVNTNCGCFYDAVTASKPLSEYIQKLPLGLWLLPSHQRMNGFPKYALQTKDAEQILNKSLQALKHQYDFILLDTPPSLKFFTLNAIIASDYIVIPTQCAYLSMHGVEQIDLIINAVRKRSGKPKEPKLLLTLYNANSAAATAVYGILQQRYPNRILQPHIPLDEAVQEAQILKHPLFDYSPRSPATLAYTAIAEALNVD